MKRIKMHRMTLQVPLQDERYCNGCPCLIMLPDGFNAVCAITSLYLTSLNKPFIHNYDRTEECIRMNGYKYEEPPCRG